MRAMQYYHALLWANGQWTVKMEDGAALNDDLESMLEAVRAKSYNTEDEDG